MTGEISMLHRIADIYEGFPEMLPLISAPYETLIGDHGLHTSTQDSQTVYKIIYGQFNLSELRRNHRIQRKDIKV
eukprot:scaffold13668_cov19-Prasinocladus_malaysianus.AAC.1